MNTRFSPSLNGSLHVGHLWMAWLNWAWAKESGGRFVLRFDDLAPACAGEDMARAGDWASEGQHLLELAGIVPDSVSYVSAYQVPGYPMDAGGRNRWLRPPSLEGWDNVGCHPALVAARVNADIREGIDAVIRGEELAPELQLYEYLNHALGAAPRQMIYLPRLRVRVDGHLTTISKTYGNLQLRDLYALDEPAAWVARVRQTGLLDPNAPVGLANVNPDPILEFAELPS